MAITSTPEDSSYLHAHNDVSELGLLVLKQWDGENSDAEEAIQRYCKHDYTVINAYLRTGDPYAYFKYPDEIPNIAEQSKIHKRDAKLITESQVASTRDWLVYRGINLKFASKLKAGDEFVEKGLASTSLSPRIASGFSHDIYDDDDVELEPISAIAKFTIPRKRKIIYPYTSFEGEIILPPGAKFRVKDIRDVRMDYYYKGDPRKRILRVVDLELLN